VLTLGYSLEYHGRDAIIDELYIIEEYRGQGIGTRAIELAAKESRSLGIKALHLEVERKNTNAQHFYRKIGFEDHDRYLLTKWLKYPPAGGPYKRNNHCAVFKLPVQTRIKK
jgi:ribosomal protein S18 acetylase RimI-like enzyme